MSSFQICPHNYVNNLALATEHWKYVIIDILLSSPNNMANGFSMIKFLVKGILSRELYQSIHAEDKVKCLNDTVE